MTRVPAALRGRILQPVPMRVIVAEARYARALNPPRIRISAERFEDLVYDLAARSEGLPERAAREKLGRFYDVEGRP